MRNIEKNKMNSSIRSNDRAGMHPSIYDSRKAIGVNLKKIPTLEGEGASAIVDPGYLAVNNDTARKKKKAGFGERPMSSNSNNSYRTKMTAGHTQFSNA